LANPTSISLTTLQNQYITIQSRYALLDNQARTEEAAYAADQAGSADLSGNTVTGVDISGGVAVSNNEFNIYSFAIRTTNIFVKYLWLILLIVFGLIGGSLMSNRAIGLSIAFRIYYLVYGSLLFPISYGLIIYQYFSSGMVDRPHFYALLAPLIPSDNMSLITKTIFFPFVYNTKSSGTKEGLARDNRLGISAPPPTPPLAKSPANNA
jgi:hypothetical protein